MSTGKPSQGENKKWLKEPDMFSPTKRKNVRHLEGLARGGGGNARTLFSCVHHSSNDICTKKQVWDPIILYTEL